MNAGGGDYPRSTEQQSENEKSWSGYGVRLLN